ncbi:MULTISPECIES: ankyrin repeat domain-containing protein [unclassified Wolbachia]|uniref:ankyrin repeat domain-containing protein n=1 Tax=unclassified Wolbachia TaxID=2640676 RepID=UPI0001986472|nr:MULTISPECIES: ankyrin repeat domain-containing protein [unclassified Wolbachia]MDX5487509.1 ankyrin repeat domain-containing protein [Wolbachia endosymbiont of Andrena praecox]MDX5497468.1 ankyrin repeat domain-containing protein [Wolbachia endosymbiont of Lasioglossum nitidulum]MDX5510104.1 ankyrin repeat domain-containing protein [Wolbachia endosymbiont of Lasioglossum morio]MDX5561715.1 ankyrin repeat domain-containing protein [Wolbachia endosymbiont of Andrena bicolor]POG52404.1 hypothe
MYLEDDSTWGVKRIYHGITFQELLIVISLMSKMGKECSFSIDTELESAQGFDDIVVRHEQNKGIVHEFTQVKHNQDGTEKISVSSLLTKSGKFSILKLFPAYLKIKNSEKFSDGIKHFFVATNMDFDSPYSIQHKVRNLRAMLSGENKGKKLSFVRIDTKDEFLDIGDSARYRISDSDGSAAQYLKQNMDFIKREIGKEVSNKEIEDFLNESVFVVNLPHEAQLRELLLGKLSSRLNKKFDYIGNNQIFCNDLLKKISDWVKDIKARPLSYKEGEELFREVELWASTLGKIEQGVKEKNERIDKVIEQQHKDSKTLHKIYVAVTTQDNKRVGKPIQFNIKHPVEMFVGRKNELQEIYDRLHKSTDKPMAISRIVVIGGSEGVGESELARKYACEYKEHYDGNLVWVNAGTQKDLEESFKGLAKELNRRLPEGSKIFITDEDTEQEKGIRSIIKSVYRYFKDVKSLFIFDNAREYKDISKFLPLSLYPDYKKPYVLITSRDNKWEARGDIEVIKLDIFNKTEALGFIKKSLNIDDPLQDKEIKELMEKLQYLPLALKQVVVYIRNKNKESKLRGYGRFEISDYLKECQRYTGKSLKEGVCKDEDCYAEAVSITCTITMTHIQKEYGCETLNILEIMAYLAPDKIRIEEIFLKLIANDEDKLRGAVELLDRYSMIDLKEKVASIHRVVQRITRLKLQKEGREEEVLRKALELVNIGGLTQGGMSHIASVWGYTSIYGKLIDNFYFNSSYVYGGTLFIRKSTPLHLLAESGDCKAISAIVTHIEKHYPGEFVKTVNVKDNHGQTLLHIAAQSGNLGVMKCLVNKGASTNTKDKYDNIPLHSAVYAGELDIVKYLVITNNNINAKGEDGRTPLHIAAINGDLDMVEYLIKSYANIDAKDNYGMTPLHLAADVGELGIVEYLINEDAYVDARDEHYRTPLFFAAENGKLNVVKCLIEKGANVNAENEYGETALHRAVYRATFSGDLRIVESLINKGANVNARDRNSKTLLHYSALSGSYNIAECLIQEGAGINAKDKDGNTALHLAVIRRKVDITKTLLKHNADVNARNNLGNTALDCAVDNCQELVELLLAHGASRDY